MIIVKDTLDEKRLNSQSVQHLEWLANDLYQHMPECKEWHISYEPFDDFYHLKWTCFGRQWDIRYYKINVLIEDTGELHHFDASGIMIFTFFTKLRRSLAVANA